VDLASAPGSRENSGSFVLSVICPEHRADEHSDAVSAGSMKCLMAPAADGSQRARGATTLRASFEIVARARRPPDYISCGAAIIVVALQDAEALGHH